MAFNFNLNSFLNLTIKVLLLSLLISYFLKENGNSNSIFTFVCGSNSETKCSDFKPGINKFFKYFTFSELGLLFYPASILSYIFINNLNNYHTILEFLLLCIGFFIIIYSLFLQLFIKKKVCRICLFIILLYIIDFSFNFSFPITYSFNLNFQFAFLLLLNLAFVEFIKLHFESISQSQKISNINKSIWRNKYIIISVLNNSKIYNHKLTNSIKFGQKNAKNICTLIITPYCKHCLNALDNMANLLLLNSEFNLNIFVKTYNIEKKDCNLKKLALSSLNNDIKEALSILHNWSNCDNINLPPKHSINVNKIVKSNKSFFNKNDYKRFPVIFINGKRIPEFIEFENIKIAFSK